MWSPLEFWQHGRSSDKMAALGGGASHKMGMKTPTSNCAHHEQCWDNLINRISVWMFANKSEVASMLPTRSVHLYSRQRWSFCLKIRIKIRDVCGNGYKSTLVGGGGSWCPFLPMPNNTFIYPPTKCLRHYIKKWWWILIHIFMELSYVEPPLALNVWSITFICLVQTHALMGKFY